MTSKRAAVKAGNAPRKVVSDASQGYVAPPMSADLTFRTVGSSGLRQWGGWVREEFLPQLTGRQAARTYREMLDNSPTVGAINFAIQQSMRQCSWRVEPVADTPDALECQRFVETLLDDMSHTWSDFIAESLTMLPYGFAPHEIVYKRRQGRNPKAINGKPAPKSKFNDGKIGWARLPIRGQDTVIKWFFDEEGSVTGLTQQPWFGGLLDIPIEKILLFRPRAHKGNPEGYSILRTAYRPWYYLKRLEEQEAVMLERFSGFPVISVPNALLKQAQDGDATAVAIVEQYKRIVRNVRVDEQMGLVIPSDTYANADGTQSSVLQYKFELISPASGRASISADTSIERYKLDIMTSVLADFLMLGHSSSSKGSQTLGEAKIDLFFQATEGWLQSNADVLNDHGLVRLWDLNGFDPDLMPKLVPDMPQRVDLDGLSNFVLRLSQSGARMFPDDDLENYLRDVADLPELSDENLDDLANVEGPENTDEQVKKHIAGMLARRFVRKGYVVSKTKKRRA